MLVGGLKHDSFVHVFVSIQSFNSKELTEITPPEYYDYIVIDEFHHAAAPSYQELLDYYRPQILLGLTATPTHRKFAERGMLIGIAIVS